MSMSLDLTASKTQGLTLTSSSGAGDEGGLGESNNNDDSVEQRESTMNSNGKSLMLHEVQQRPKTAPGPDLGKSFSIQSFNSVGHSSSGNGMNSSASSGDISPAGGGLGE